MRTYTETLLNEGAYEESMFLDIVQVLEHFHGVIFPKESRYLEKESWKSFMDRLAPNLLQSLRELNLLTEDEIEKLSGLLKNRIASLNKLSFRSRLTQLFNEIPRPYLMQLIGKPDKPNEAIEDLLRRIESTRHFLIHHEEDQAKHAMFDQELRKAIVSCWAILTYWLARKVGFSPLESGDIGYKAGKVMFFVSKKPQL